MHSKILRIYLVTAVISLLLFSGMYATAAESNAVKQQSEITKLELSISKDGKAIVDQNGNEVARFVEGMQVQTTTEKKVQKMPGCMRCWYECIAWEGERCVQKIRTCQWDFDCE
jgi:hypothetical protein